MKVNGKPYQTIWLKPGNPKVVQTIDQRYLPFEFKIENLTSVEGVYTAIKEMHVRGAPLIGITGAYGMYLASLVNKKLPDFNEWLIKSAEKLKSARPTAINLSKAIEIQIHASKMYISLEGKRKILADIVLEMAEIEKESCKQIGLNGLAIIERISQAKKGKPVNILTHCNAGWLACIDYGTATAPIYFAHEAGIKVHIWVDETRPWNQGSRLTAWELQQEGVPYTIISDNTGGHLMQHEMVDLVIVGSDRTTIKGDTANKIGTYLKALAAKDNQVPFYVALPSSSIDFTIEDGLKEIPIELRDEDEVKYVTGYVGKKIVKVLIAPKESKAVNYSFDVTPAHLITGLITDRGICKAKKEEIINLFPEISC